MAELMKWDDIRGKLVSIKPFSKLFVRSSPQVTEEQFRSEFGKYGTIEHIGVLKHDNGEPKGITFIRFSKSSEAVHAMEELNGRIIAFLRPALKIMFAHSPSQDFVPMMDETEQVKRLYLSVPKSMTNNELHHYFKEFGVLDYASVVRDRKTKESTGYAYVRFHRAYDAAKALEGCDPSFRAAFAKSTKPTKKKGLPSAAPWTCFGATPAPNTAPLPELANQSPLLSLPVPLTTTSDPVQSGEENCASLLVIASPTVQQGHLWRLFNILPGLNHLRMDEESGKGHAVAIFTTPDLATYARTKLHGFEYPPGERLIVKPDPRPIKGDGLLGDAPYPAPVNGVPFSATPKPCLLPMSQVPQPNSGGPFSATANRTLLPTPQLQDTVPQPVNGGPFSATAMQSLRPTPQQSAIDPQASLLNLSLPTLAETLAQATAIDPQASLLNLSLPTLAETLAQATSLIKAAGLIPGFGKSESEAKSRDEYDPSYCSVKLPPPQPLAPMGSKDVERLFFICKNGNPPEHALRDVFGRFGNLIDAFLVNGKSCGFAKYANKESAQAALQALHGQDVCGMRLKVVPALERGSDDQRKRRRMD